MKKWYHQLVKENSSFFHVPDCKDLMMDPQQHLERMSERDKQKGICRGLMRASISMTSFPDRSIVQVGTQMRGVW
jgi:hypothetical protein